MLFLIVNESQPKCSMFLATVLQTILSINDCKLLDDRRSAVTRDLSMLGAYGMNVKLSGLFDEILWSLEGNAGDIVSIVITIMHDLEHL